MRIIRPVKVTKEGTFTRASTGTYWDKTGIMRTAVANALRITYDPANLNKAPYALIEPAATNLLLDSEDLTTGNWTKTNVSISANTAVAPNGTSTADKLVESTANAQHYSYFSRTGTNETITLSAYVKAAGRTMTYLCMSNFVNASCGAYFDLAAGKMLGTDPANFDFTAPSAKIQDVGNGWFRCAFTVTKSAFNTTSTAQINVGTMVAGAPSLVYAGDGVSGLYVWGVQLEAGTAATSYIPTTTAVVTRAADVVGSTGLVYTNVPENDYPAWSATKVYAQGDRVLDLPSHKVLESVSGQTGTATFTASSAGNVTMKKVDGTAYVPAVGNAVVFTGTPPTGVVSGTTYYVQAVTAVAFSISATAGGAAITTGAQATPITALASSNLNIPITNVTQWLDAGYDNRWDMFDDSVTSQTSQAGDVVISFYPGTRLDAIAAFNLVANNMKISFVDVVTGESLYSASVNLISNSGIQNFYDYLFEPIVQSTECLVDGIPLGLSANSLITVTFSSNGTTKVGGLLFGLEKDVGITEWGAKVGIIDYSVKTKDAFGNYTITPRAFSKRGDFTVQVPTSQVDALQSLLATFRATPIVYIGSNSGNKTQFNSTMIYGFYKDFDINIAYNAYSVCSMTVEGLT